LPPAAASSDNVDQIVAHVLLTGSFGGISDHGEHNENAA
jgi:hypothetical protein